MSSHEFGEQQQTPMAWEDFINAQLENGNTNLPPVHGHPYDTSRHEGEIAPMEIDMFGEPVIDVRTLVSDQRRQLDPEFNANLLSHLANEGTIVRGTFSLQATQPGHYPFISADTTEIDNNKGMETTPLLGGRCVEVDSLDSRLHNAMQAVAVKRGMLRFVADVQLGRNPNGIVIARVRNVYADESPYAGTGDTPHLPGDSVIMQGQVAHYHPGTENDIRDPGSITVYSPEMGEQTVGTQLVGPLSFSREIRADRTVNHLHHTPMPGDEVQVRAFLTTAGDWSITPSGPEFTQKSRQVEVIRLVKAGDENALDSLHQYDAFAVQMEGLRQAATPAETRARHAMLLRQIINPDKYTRRQQPYVMTPDQQGQVSSLVESFVEQNDRERSLAMHSEIISNKEDILETVLKAEAALGKDILGMTFPEFAKTVEAYASGGFDMEPTRAFDSIAVMDIARNLSKSLYGASMFTFYGRGIPAILDRTPNAGPGTGALSPRDGEVLRQMLIKPEPFMSSYSNAAYAGRVGARRLGAYSQIVESLSDKSLQTYGLDRLLVGKMAFLLKQPFEQKRFNRGPVQVEDFTVVKDQRLLQVVQDVAPGVIARLRQSIYNKPLPEPNHPMYKHLMEEQEQVANLEEAMTLIQQRQQPA